MTKPQISRDRLGVFRPDNFFWYPKYQSCPKVHRKYWHYQWTRKLIQVSICCLLNGQLLYVQPAWLHHAGNKGREGHRIRHPPVITCRNPRVKEVFRRFFRRLQPMIHVIKKRNTYDFESKHLEKNKTSGTYLPNRGSIASIYLDQTTYITSLVL